MNDVFFNMMMLESIALESAISLYEVECGFDEEYLHNDVSYDAQYNQSMESAYNEDNIFGFDLFSSIALEDADPNAGGTPADPNAGGTPANPNAGGTGSSTKSKDKKSFGERFKDGLTNFFNTISKGFSTLGDKVSQLIDKVKVNLAAASEKFKESTATHAVISKAKSLQRQFQAMIKIIKDGTKEAAKTVNEMITDINKALTAAVGDTRISKNAAADQDTLKSVGRQFAGRTSDDNDDASNYANSNKDLQKAESALSKCERVMNRLESGTDSLRKTYVAFTEACTHLKHTEDLANARYSDSYSRVGGQFNSYPDKEEYNATKKVKDKREEAESSRVNKFNSAHPEYDDVNLQASDKNTKSNYEVTKEMASRIFMQYEYKQKTDITELLTTANDIKNNCNMHVDFCTKAAKLTRDTVGDSPATKLAWNLCKFYLKTQRVFSGISQYLTMMTTGAIFKGQLYDGKPTISDGPTAPASWAPTIKK